MNPIKQKRIQEIFKRRMQKTPPVKTDIFIITEPDVSVPCPRSLDRSGFFAIIILGLQLLCGASQTIRRCWPLFAALLLIGTGLTANTQPVSACDTNPAPAMRPIEQIQAAESIDTTMRYYVGRNAQVTAAVLWDAHKAAATSGKLGNLDFSNGFGNGTNSRGQSTNTENTNKRGSF